MHDLPAPVHPETAPAGDRWLFLPAAPDSLPCAVHLPPGDPPPGGWPVLLFLHGVGECGTDGRAQTTVGLGPALREHPERWPFLAVLPQKPFGGEWEDHLETVVALLDAVAARHHGASSPPLLTGISHGGHGAWTFASLRPDRWSALVPMCGYLGRWPVDSWMDWEVDRSPERLRALAEAIGPLPVWAFHGEDDPAIPLEQTRAAVEALRANRNPARLTSYPGVQHECWVQAFADPELPSWLSRAVPER